MIEAGYLLICFKIICIPFLVKLVAFKPFENFSIEVWNQYLLSSTYVSDRSELAFAHPLLSIVIPYSPLPKPSSKPMCVWVFKE